jgi:hypothetical protein
VAKGIVLSGGVLTLPNLDEADVDTAVLLSPERPFSKEWRLYRASDLAVAAAVRFDVDATCLDTAFGARDWAAFGLLFGDIPPFSASRVASHLRHVSRHWTTLGRLAFLRDDVELSLVELINEELGPMLARWSAAAISGPADLTSLADRMDATSAPLGEVVAKMILETWNPRDPRFSNWFRREDVSRYVDKDLISLVSSGHPYAEPLLKAQLLLRRLG